MDFKLILAIILSILPVSELRGGMPLMILYANQHNIPIFLAFLIPILTNILAIFIAFYFLDNLHKIFIKNKTYKGIFNTYLGKLQQKTKQFEEKYSVLGFLALTIFVAIPLPGTGAWTGCIISWMLKLDRNKSIFSISIGVIIAGILMLLGTLGFITLFS